MSAAPGALPYRWVILAAGSAATAAFSAAQGALPALGPAIQEAFSLTLVEVTGVFTAFGFGTMLTALAWGMLADRVGERVVVTAGMGTSAVALVAVAQTDGYAALLGSVLVAGMLGVSSVAGSGRAVFGWFQRSERGFALGVRQTAVPVGAAAASFSLPPLAAGSGLDAALLALAAVTAVAALACGVWLREAPPRRSSAPPAPPAGRDPRIWRLSVASGLMIVAQIGVTSLLVLYLHGERDWSPTGAAAALGLVQVGGALARLAAGRWSDSRDERIQPFRSLAAAAGVLLMASAFLSGAPDAVLVPVLLAGGVAAMSWNGLSFTAAAEISGGRQAGTAMGIQNTVLRVMSAGVPLGVALLAEGVSWWAAFLVMGLAPLAGRAMLAELVLDEDRRREERRRRLAEAARLP